MYGRDRPLVDSILEDVRLGGYCVRFSKSIWSVLHDSVVVAVDGRKSDDAWENDCYFKLTPRLESLLGGAWKN